MGLPHTGMLMYAVQYGDMDLDRRHLEEEISVSMKKVQTYAEYISNDVKDSDGRRKMVE